ncbi:MAG: hypothetical protein ACYDH5_06635 [Acidimicrobiales bacterium]
MSLPGDRGARHTCLDFSPGAIRDHFAFMGVYHVTAAFTDDELARAARVWLEAGSPQPWKAYDRFCRMILVLAREASRPKVAGGASAGDDTA